jgi:hypothetical protein
MRENAWRVTNQSAKIVILVVQRESLDENIRELVLQLLASSLLALVFGHVDNFVHDTHAVDSQNSGLGLLLGREMGKPITTAGLGLGIGRDLNEKIRNGTLTLVPCKKELFRTWRRYRKECADQCRGGGQ